MDIVRTIAAAALALGVTVAGASQAAGTGPAGGLRLVALQGDSGALLQVDGQPVALQRGGRSGAWTLVETLPGGGSTPALAVLEDFTRIDGPIAFVDAQGLRFALPKTAEPTWADPATLFLGHTAAEVMQSAHDLLGEQLLAKPGDPSYDEVAGAFAPIHQLSATTWNFIGTPDSPDKVGFAYGGRSPDFDPALYDPQLGRVREQGRVLDGLVGGDLPVLRFVYPEGQGAGEGAWTELLAFAPFRVAGGNPRLQPVWYRVSHVEHGVLQWSRYVDSYQAFPPRAAPAGRGFYADLVQLRARWLGLLGVQGAAGRGGSDGADADRGMRIEVPDARVADMARFGLVREMMTRVGDAPRYGAVDKDYAGSEHEGFPDTFTVGTAAMLDWGLIGRAGRYIDDYLGHYVRDDGSLLYRGPETGQYGRMLTVVAQYLSYGGDPGLLLRHRSRIDGITRLLLGLREKAKALPASDPAYGMIAGWSEADSCLDPEPQRYMQPYFSNSTEAARGFRDIGRAWQQVGRARHDAALVAWGERLQREARELRADLDRSLARSLLEVDGEQVLPAIAGVREPFHVAVPRDRLDPQFRSYRAWMEMMYSGSLTRAQARLVEEYRARHHDLVLGVPSAYGYSTMDIAGFLSYGHAYGLIQHDFVRDAQLLLYGVMAHGHTRGGWLAPETHNLLPEGSAAPYATPAQLTVPMVVRWLLVFEDPESDTLWLGKGLPRDWLRDGELVAVDGAPTRWGRVGYRLVSHLDAGTIEATLELPARAPALVQLRLRVPGGARIHAVTLGGKRWTQFDAQAETVSIPAEAIPAAVAVAATANAGGAGRARRLQLTVSYR